jgi:hypothetical protein
MKAISRRVERFVAHRTPLWWALTMGLVGACIAWLVMRDPTRGDFAYWYTAAQALVRGTSPYAVIPASDPTRFGSPLFYPLPAVLLTVPFTPLPYTAAAMSFVFLSSAALAYGVARTGAHRLFLFAGAPFVVTAATGGFPIAITAAAVVPALGFLTFVKPNVGLATFLYRPTRWMFVGSALFFAFSLLAWPSWPREWLAGLGTVQDRMIPIATPVGPLLLLAALRWRRAEARLLLGYACVPQAPWFYDQVILFLIPATALETMNYALITQVSLAAWLMLGLVRVGHGAWLLAAVLYLPPLIMILRRPNVGSLTGSLHREADAS